MAFDALKTSWAFVEGALLIQAIRICGFVSNYVKEASLCLTSVFTSPTETVLW